MQGVLVNVIVGFGSAVIGAVLGSYSTWLFQKKESTEALHQNRIQSYRYCMSHIGIMKSTLLNLDREFLKPVENDPDRHVIIKTVGDFGSHVGIDLNKMSFLIDLHQPQLYAELYVAKSRYEIVIGALAFRNESKEIAMKTAIPIQIEGELTPLRFELRPEYLHRLSDATDNLYDSVKDALSTLDDVLEKLTQSLSDFDASAKPVTHTIIDN